MPRREDNTHYLPFSPFQSFLENPSIRYFKIADQISEKSKSGRNSNLPDFLFLTNGLP